MGEVLRPYPAEEGHSNRPTREALMEAVQRIIDRGPERYSLANDISALAKGEHPNADQFANLYPGWTKEDFQQMSDELESAEDAEDNI